MAFGTSLIIDALVLALVIDLCDYRFWRHAEMVPDASHLQEKDCALLRAEVAWSEAKREEAEKGREYAELASRQRDDFIAILSHELRGPLGSVVGYAEIIAAGECESAEVVKQFAAVICRNGKDLIELVNDLIDVSRAAHGKLLLKTCTLDLRKVVSDAVEALSLDARTRGLEMALALPTEGAPCEGDAVRIAQVVRNLLTNALKFTQRGGRIKVSLRLEGAGYLIQVKDNGVGIEPEFLPHLFNRFSQGAPERQAGENSGRQAGGLGLGLFIVRQLTELHGGYVTAESPGKGLGTTLEVYLPRLRRAPVSTV